MELELDHVQRRHQDLQNALRYWTEVLQKSEKYERLNENEDWQEVRKELGHVLKVHEGEIAKALDTLSELNSKQRDDAYNVIYIHQLRKEQIQEALREPERILNMAKEAREKIPEIKEAIRRHQEELVHG